MNDQNTTQPMGPAWELSSEYPAPDAAEVERDLADLTELHDEIAAMHPAIGGSEDPATLRAAQEVFRLSVKAGDLLRNLTTYASCRLSVDSRDEAAQVLQGRLLAHQTRHAELLEPLAQFVDSAPDASIRAYLAEPEVSAAAFSVHHARRRRHERLPLAEENLISALAQDGINAWGRLYTQLSGTMHCEVEIGGATRRLGLAEAAALMQKQNPATRRAAWLGINAAWEAQEEVCAAALNAIAGWRLEECRKRSRQKRVHFLDAPVHANRISRSTLDALVEAAERALPLARRAAAAMARASGRDQLGPWDLRAPAPAAADDTAERLMPFDDALELIVSAYADVHPDMGDFVRMMGAQRWIEGTVGPAKRPGAYCTSFAKSRTPRVYMTYEGAPSDVITLAHELGHAFHGWVLRDLPSIQRTYGMSLAETASTFGEATVRAAMQQRARTDAEQLAIAWQDVAAIPTFLLNIPVRFGFERRFYERRGDGPVRPAELKRMMAEAWQQCYGGAMCEPDPMFWASKLHFYIAATPFYNFPYLFGYLFSMGVYQRKDEFGDEFYPRYLALLRDTGRMTAEELAEKHLGADLTHPDFWCDVIAKLAPSVDAFEALAAGAADSPAAREER
jgi:oligoendopeptidase F